MKVQVAREVFLTSVSTMKKVLSLAEFKLGKKTEEYKYFKKQTMDYFFNGLKSLFNTLVENKVLVKCECKAPLRKGYSDCPKCGGSGYRDIEK